MRNRSENTRKFFYGLLAAAIALLVVAMAALWAVALCYAIALQVAWGSEMAFFTVFGLSFIGAGLCLIGIHGFAAYMRKVWFDHWPDAPGAKFFLRNSEEDYVAGSDAPVDESTAETVKSAIADKTILKNAKNKSSSAIIKPKFLTIQNAAYALLALAVVFVIVSAALGSLEPTAWVEARSDYMTSRGWFADSVAEDLEFPADEVSSIEVDITERNVVVVYDKNINNTRVSVKYYSLYRDEYVISQRGDDSYYVLAIMRTEEPSHDSALDTMLDLCFQPNRIEKQVTITVPDAYRDRIEIIGENIIYAK